MSILWYNKQEEKTMREQKEKTMAGRNEKKGPGLKGVSSWDRIGYIEDR
jgi:hypothetical protein